MILSPLQGHLVMYGNIFYYEDGTKELLMASNRQRMLLNTAVERVNITLGVSGPKSHVC